MLAPCLLVTAAAFSNAAPNIFIYDDNNWLPIARPAGESLLASLTSMFRDDPWAATRSLTQPYRPLTWASFLVDQRFWDGWRTGFHLTSIALHSLASVLVFLLLRAVLTATRAPASPARAWLPALLAAAVFALHPIHTEAVDSVFNRSEILATVCVLGSLLALARLEARRPAAA
nr:hypothetical protein [Deltaproteobacteria bacterium]